MYVFFVVQGSGQESELHVLLTENLSLQFQNRGENGLGPSSEKSFGSGQ